MHLNAYPHNFSEKCGIFSKNILKNNDIYYIISVLHNLTGISVSNAIFNG